MVENGEYHVDSSSSRDEINIIEAESNVIPMEDLNDGVEGHDNEQQQQQQLQQQQQVPNNENDANSNVAEMTTPTEETQPETVISDIDEAISNEITDYDDEPDETIKERLLALGDMFPEPLRYLIFKASEATRKSIHKVFRSTCRATWVICTSAIILLAPVAFENERIQLKEFQKLHEKQALFGPNTIAAAQHTGGRIKTH